MINYLTEIICDAKKNFPEVTKQFFLASRMFFSCNKNYSEWQGEKISLERNLAARKKNCLSLSPYPLFFGIRKHFCEYNNRLIIKK